MVAPLVPKDRIPELAQQVDSAAKFKVLRRLKQERGVIINDSDVDEATANILEQFTAGGLVDDAYAGGPDSKPQSWTMTVNGERVLEYLETELPRLSAEREEKDAEERAKRAEWLK